MKEIIMPVTIAGLTFKNPFYVASGPTTKSLKQLIRIEETGWAAASIKLIIAPTPYINRKPRYGLFANQTALAFTTEKRLTYEEGLKLIEDGKKSLKELLLFANITYAGDDGIAGWVAMSKAYESAGSDVIELNMCCPNMSYNLQLTTGDSEASAKKTGASLGQLAGAVAEIVAAVKSAVNIPVFVKLTPEGGQIANVSKALFAAGADAVGGTANRMGIADIDLEAPVRSTYHFQDEISMSCHSGPWITPLAQRDTYEIRKVCGPDVRMTATGGVTGWENAVRMIMCGADIVGVCTATLTEGYDIVRPMLEGVKRYMVSHGYGDLRQMRDLIVSEVKTAAEVTQYAGYAKITNPHLAAPCKTACPHHVPAQAYIRSVAKRDFKAAYDCIVSKNPLQTVCGYVCNHVCEDACTQGLYGHPVPIKAIKRFVMEYGARAGGISPPVIGTKRHKRVAIIGSGPAGLSCAYSLAQGGYDVTVFEREQELGGALRYAIPAFRLPRQVVDEQLNLLKGMGVAFKIGVAFGKDVTIESLKSEGYEAVFLGIGAQKSTPLGIPGEDSLGVVSALAFLRENVQRETDKKRDLGDVVVGGGGVTAIDSARTAVRLGATSVYVTYRRTKDEMPAAKEEIDIAEAEGISFIYLAAPVSVIAVTGKVEGLELGVQTLGKKDESQRRRPVQVDDARFTLKCDTIICAIGQKAEIDTVALVADEDAVYTGGDAVKVDSVIAAIAAGKRAAVSMDKKLSGKNAVLEDESDFAAVNPYDVLSRTPFVAPGKQWETDDLERVMTEDEAVAEALRCLNCGCGEGCQRCKTICCDFAPVISGIDRVEINKDDCVACGMCYNLCPNRNIEMVREDTHR